jgi:hypothetical protein
MFAVGRRNNQRLVDIWNELVRNDFTVLFPELSILAMTSLVVTLNANEEESRHVEDVKVGEDVARAAGHAHGQRDQKVTNVVKVTGETPESRSEKERLVDFSIRGNVLGPNDLSRLSPDFALAVRRSDNVLLIVDSPEDIVSTHSSRENNGKVGPA